VNWVKTCYRELGKDKHCKIEIVNYRELGKRPVCYRELGKDNARKKLVNYRELGKDLSVTVN
jgi:hypothetical protein